MMSLQASTPEQLIIGDLSDVGARAEIAALGAVRRYFDAWNRGDGRAVSALFTDDGWYSDPTTNGRIAGDALASRVTALWRVFPHLVFETVSVHQPVPSLVIIEWRMNGINTGGFRRALPTGKSVLLRGVDVITVAGAKLHTVTSYFDSQRLPLQLGPQIAVQPEKCTVSATTGWLGQLTRIARAAVRRMIVATAVAGVHLAALRYIS